MYRQGAVGALLDIYEQAIQNFKKTIEDISDDVLTMHIDPHTTDENCKSIQTVISHVVSSGYSYAVYINNLKGQQTIRPEKTFHLTATDYLEDLNQVLAYTETVFKNIKNQELEEFDNAKKIITSWGQYYDIEQLMEHAIVHILRHQRQIEKFKNVVL